MKALYTQLEHELARYEVQGKVIESVFIGGGTPSTVSAELYAPIFELITPFFKDNIEVTSEVNPNSGTIEWMRGLFNLGVNRLSFGVQSFNNEKLKKLARAHNSDQAKSAITNAKKVGFKNISLDIIYATAFESKALLEEDLKIAFTLPINHLSAYALTIEANTAFEHTPEVALEKLERTQWFLQAIKDHGFEQYEISNFGTYKSKHNLGYWEYKDYIGAGAGAVGFLKDTRYYPLTDIEQYIKTPLSINEETLSAEEILSEKIFLGFRSLIGVDKKILSAYQIQRAEILLEEEKLTFLEGKYYNPDYLLSDELALFLDT